MIYVLKQVSMGPAQICSFVIGDACDDAFNPLHEWEVAFPPVKKPPIKPPIPPQEAAPTFKVLHISDTHYDPYYQEGANAECNEPLCCRLTNGAPLAASAAAGRWGDYRKCDTPKRTIDHMLKHIADTHSVSNDSNSSIERLKPVAVQKLNARRRDDDGVDETVILEQFAARRPE